MADVTLTLKGDNKDLIRSLDEVQKKQQQVQDTATRGEKENTKQRTGFIELEEKRLKLLKEARDKTYSTYNLEYYNKEIKRTSQNIDDLKKKGVDAFNSTEKSAKGLMGTISGLVGKISLIGIAIAAATRVIRDMVGALKDSENGWKLANEFAIRYKQTLYEISTGTTRSRDVIKRTIEMEKLSLEILNEKCDLLKKTADLQLKYETHRHNAAKEEIGSKGRLEELTLATEAYNAMMVIEIAHLEKIWEYTKLDFENRPKSTKAKLAEAEAYRNLALAKAAAERETLRVDAQKAAEERRERQELKDKWFAEIEANNKAQDEILRKREEFKNLSLQLVEEYDRAAIESLEGADKLAAQRDYELKAIEMFRAQMKKLGTLTKEQEDMFIEMGRMVWDSFYQGLKDEADKTAEAYDKWLQSHFMDVVDFLAKEQKELDKDLNWIYNKIDALNDREEKQKEERIQQVEETASAIIDMLDDVYQRRVDDARRTREIYDQQVSELQQDVQTELELKKAGYASNVSAKQNELRRIKEARDSALREEEKAIRKQQQMQLLSQSLSLATSVAKLIEAGIEEGGLVGLIIAGLEVAAMFVMWDQYKKQISAATRLAKGGSGTDKGMVTGKSHAAGGERFTDQIEVERGEAWGVLSVPATQKYGKVFHEMVSSFNKGEIPAVVSAPTVNNKVLVDNNGSNSRLDQLIRENKKLNDKLSQESVQEMGTSRIIRKNDNIRTVRR